MNPILVASTSDSTGKTAVALALARHAAAAGLDVGYTKPKGTRLESAVGKTRDEDPLFARDLLGLEAEVHEMEPIVYSETFLREVIRGREDPAALADRLRESYGAVAADRDLVIVEGADQYTTGGVVDLADPDVADLLDASVVLLADYGSPGDVDGVLAAADAFRDRLRGVLFNAVPDEEFDELSEDVIPFLEGRGVTVLGAIPAVRELAGVTVAELADRLGAEVLTDRAPTDALLRRFLVGAMGGEAALRHFRRTRDAAVITGGDRADVHTAAIEAPGVACLVLAGGLRPSEAVIGRAEDDGTPVLLVRTDTRTTIDRAEELVRSGRTRDAGTVDRMEELLADGVDVEALLGL